MSMEEKDLFDPETGKPLTEETEAADLFDPETGKPLTKETEAADLFDPETGKPLTKENRTPDLFDPETGKPLNQGAGAPDLFDPETGKPLSNTSRPSGGKKSKKPIFIVAVAVCACAAVTALVMGGSLFKKPKDVVSEALMEIVDTVDQGFLEDTFGIKELRKQAASGSVRIGGSVEIEDLPVLGTLGSGSGSVEFSRDTGSKAVQMTGTAEIANMDLGSFIMYIDDKKIATSAPGISDYTFVLNYANDLPGQVEDSYMFSQIGLDEEDAEQAARLMAEANRVLTGEQKQFQLKKTYERFKETTKASENLKNSLEIEKAVSKSFHIRGKDIKCKGYNVTVPRRAAADFVKATGKFIDTDEELKSSEIDYLTDLLTSSYMLRGWNYENSRRIAENEISRWLDKIRNGSDVVESFIRDYMDDIEMVLYVDNKGHAVYLEIETSIDVENSYNIRGEFTFEGGAIPTKNMEGSIKVSNRAKSLTLSIDKEEKDEKDKYTSEHTFRFSENGMGLKLVIKSDYNKKSGDFETEISGTYGMARYIAAIKGAIIDYKKGKSLEVELDSVKFKGPGYSLNMDLLSGSFFIEPFTDKLTAPKGDEFDVVASDELDWNEAYNDFLPAIRDVDRLFYSY